MRVLAASFPDDARARAARARLLAELELEAQQVGVEILAEPRAGGAPQAVVAGQFDEALVSTAKRLVEDMGGTVVVDIDATETNA